MMNDAAPPSIHREGRDQSTSSSFLSNISQEDTNRSALRAKGAKTTHTSHKLYPNLKIAVSTR